MPQLGTRAMREHIHDAVTAAMMTPYQRLQAGVGDPRKAMAELMAPISSYEVHKVKLTRAEFAQVANGTYPKGQRPENER